MLDEHVFKGDEKIHGKFLLDLGRAYLHTNCLIGNQSSLFRMILFPDKFPTLPAKNRPTAENLKKTENFLQQVLEEFMKGNKKMNRKDEDVIQEELLFTCDFLIFACQFGAAYAHATWEQGLEKISSFLFLFLLLLRKLLYFDFTKVPVADLKPDVKQDLAEKLQNIIKRYYRI